MAKRFTATEKWADRWFRRLPVEWKAAWQYLCDICDLAGVIDLDEELAEFCLGASIDWDAFIEASGERIVRLESGKLYLTRFIQFQYGELSEANRMHAAVIKQLEKHGASKGHPSPLQGAKDNTKVKDKVTKGGVGGDEFAAWWSTYPRRVGKQAAAKAYAKAVGKLRGRPATEGGGGDNPHGFLRERALAFSASPKGQGEFCPHPSTWLNEGRYDDDPRTWSDSRGSPSKSKSESATEEFLRRHGDGDPSSGGGGGESHLRLPGPSG